MGKIKFSFQNNIYRYIKKNKIKSIFYGTLLISIFMYLIIFVLSKGKYGIQLFHPDPNDTYMDFFNVLFMNYGMDPIPKNIYPPFAALMMVPFYSLVPREIVNNGPFFMRGAQAGLMSLSFFIIISLICLFSAIDYSKKGKKIEKMIFLFIVLLSSPFLFQFERQNLIIFSLVFLMGFVFLKDSKNKIIREISLIFLACSACIKIYPVIFGLLLIKEKRYKETFRVMIYGILIFILPFFIFGGLSKIKPLIENIFSTNAEFFNRGFGYKVDLINFFRILGSFFNLDDSSIISIISKLAYLLVIIAIPAALALKSNWKTITLLTCIVVATPSFSWMYNLVYYIIPIIMFLDSDEKRTKCDYLFLIGFIALLCPIQFGTLTQYGKYKLTYDVFIKNFFVVFMYFYLIANGYINLYKNFKGKYIVSKQENGKNNNISL